MQPAQRLQLVPPYLFAEIRDKISEARARGVDVISLGIGDPDQPTPPHIVAELCRAVDDVHDPDRHRYGGDLPVEQFPVAVAEWYGERYGVDVDPESEVLPLIGSKEGIAHMAWAVINPGEVALAPEPGYTVYATGPLFAGGSVHSMPLLAENGFLPDLESIPAETAAAAKLMWLNYPNNPTAALAPIEFFQRAVDFCRRHDILLCHDAAYSLNTFDGYRAPSVLEVEDAKQVAVEFQSLSKPYNMTGWRVAFAVGNADAIAALEKMKDNIDSGILRAIQFAAVEALTGPQDCLEELNRLYQRRRDLAVDTLNRLGWELEKPKATFYIWAPVPERYNGDSRRFAADLLDRAAVVVTPGVGYGPSGEGFFRISLTYPDEVLALAFERIEAALG